MKSLFLFIFVLILFQGCSSKKYYTPQEGSIYIDNIDLNNISGKRTFIGFVGTFCPHCRDEVPVLDKFYRDYKDQVNMQLINTDGKKFIGDYKNIKQLVHENEVLEIED